MAKGAAIEVKGTGALPRERVQVEIRLDDGRWARLAGARANQGGRFAREVRPKRARRRIVLRATSPTATSNRVRVKTRPIVLASVGDVNLGNGPGAVMALRGFRYPWTSVAPALRAADVAFGNLECAVSTRGSPVPKEFNFRGPPAALQACCTYF